MLLHVLQDFLFLRLPSEHKIAALGLQFQQQVRQIFIKLFSLLQIGEKLHETVVCRSDGLQDFITIVTACSLRLEYGELLACSLYVGQD